MNETFESRIENKEIDVRDIGPLLGVEDYLCDTTCTAKVNWRFEVEARDWGIKDISVSIESLFIEIAVEIQEGDNTIDKIIHIDAGYLIANGWEIKNSLEIGSSIYPKALDVDFDKKIIEVE